MTEKPTPDPTQPATPKAKPARAKSSKPKPPERPANLPHGRWLGDLGKLSAAEQALVACCARGKLWAAPDLPEHYQFIGPKQLEETPIPQTKGNTIRADVIRFLMLGGDADNPVHEFGVMLRGAWVTGKLSLHQAHCKVRLSLRDCHLQEEPSFNAARLPQLLLTGCCMPGLVGDGLVVDGDLVLNNNFLATDEVRLLGASIGGDLDCSGGRFDHSAGVALHADRADVKGGVFLNHKFHSTGEVRFLGASIGGHLTCSGGRFDHPAGDALNVDGSKVTGALLLRAASVNGSIDLTAARVGSLVDDKACWQAGDHFLDGLHYDSIIGFTDAKSRIAWLKQQRPDQLGFELKIPAAENGQKDTLFPPDFKPQPWEQLIKVLRDTGHINGARVVAIAKQEQMRKAGVINGRWQKPMHWIYGKMAGYGHRPLKLVKYMFAVWLFCAVLFFAGGIFGYFGPSNPIIHADPAFAVCTAPGDGSTYWTSSGCPTPPEYTTFFAPAYSLDVILPLVDLQQELDWAPVVVNSKGEQLWLGHGLRALLWFEILFGWFASLMFVAIVGRLVEKD